MIRKNQGKPLQDEDPIVLSHLYSENQGYKVVRARLRGSMKTAANMLSKVEKYRSVNELKVLFLAKEIDEKAIAGILDDMNEMIAQERVKAIED